jgi:Flp pilus assembly protein TadG
VRRIGGKKLAERDRRAAAVVELAVVSPLMFAMLFGIIEFGWLFTVQHTMVNAAREGARLGILEGITTAEVEARVLQFLQPMGVDDDVTMTVTNVETATPGDPFVTVSLTVPREQVSLVGNFFGFVGGTLEGSATMRKEGM